MSIHVERSGLQTTIQAGPRVGQRHLGIPAAGAADPLSLALANRLVGNSSLAAGLEATLTGPLLGFEASGCVAVTGAKVRITLNGATCPLHAVIRVRPGDRLDIGACESGARAYLAFGGGLRATPVLGSVSTYLPARLGGLDGRALERGDRLEMATSGPKVVESRAPDEYQPEFAGSLALRVCAAGEYRLLGEAARDLLLSRNWIAGRRADRMGIELEGPGIDVATGGVLPSAAVFPGTLQCPENGVPFLLGVDAQTTGGYPRLLQVARCDRHLVGQLVPGDRLRFLWREPAAAAADLEDKHAYWRRWVPDIDRVI
jgi:biotin-dependent carboxylase-like uncharacterized protein